MSDQNTHEIYLDNNGSFSDAITGSQVYVSELITEIKRGVTIVNTENKERLTKDDLQEWIWLH